jgi:hypothetical protein
MGLLNRIKRTPPAGDSGGTDAAAPTKPAKPAKPAKPVRVRPPRVVLRREELREAHTLKSMERYIAFGLAVYSVIAVLVIALPNGVTNTEALRVGFGLLAAGLLGVLARYKGRMAVVMGCAAVAMLLTLSQDTKNPSQLAGILPFPLLGFVMYLYFSMMKSQQEIKTRRILAGDLANPVDERRASKSGKPVVAKEDSTGKQLAAQSKRYTPPKAKKKP